MKKILKTFLYILLIALVFIQFIHPQKNISSANAVFSNDISAKYPLPDTVKSILQTSCYDCHSNNTVYPWYSKIQPVAWWLSDHINEGKRELNFNEFSSYRIRRQYKKLEKIINEIKEDEMPLSSYTLIHKNAVLTPAQKQIIYDWANQLRENIKMNNPPDSLVKK